MPILSFFRIQFMKSLWRVWSNLQKTHWTFPSLRLWAHGQAQLYRKIICTGYCKLNLDKGIHSYATKKVVAPIYSYSSWLSRDYSNCSRRKQHKVSMLAISWHLQGYLNLLSKNKWLSCLKKKWSWYSAAKQNSVPRAISCILFLQNL